MALVSTPNLTIFSLANDGTGGTWVGASGGFDSQVNYQGANCWYYQTPKNGVGNGNFAPTAAVNMSAADTHLYWSMRCDVFQFCELLNTGATTSGLMCKIESSGGSKTFHIAGRDTWGGEWKSFVLDVNNTANVFETVGTLDLTAVTKISWLTDNSNSGTIRIVDNTMLDAIRFGTGLTLTGTLWDLEDAAIDDELKANKYGVLQLIDGNVHCQGRIIAGDGVTVTTFNSTDEILIFKDAIVSSTLYKLSFVGSGNTSIIKGLVTKGAGTTDISRFALDASDSTVGFTMTGSTFIRGGLIEFTPGANVKTSIFNNCYQITPSTAIFEDNSIKNYIGTLGGSLLWGGGTTTKNCVFENNAEDIEHDTAGAYTYDNLVTSLSTIQANNTSGGTVTASAINGTNFSTGSSTLVTISNDVALTWTIKDELSGLPIENARIEVLKVSDKSQVIAPISTDAGGIATDNISFAGDLSIQGWVRQFDIIGTDYVQKNFVGTITSTGLSQTILLTPIT